MSERIVFKFYEQKKKCVVYISRTTVNINIFFKS